SWLLVYVLAPFIPLTPPALVALSLHDALPIYWLWFVASFDNFLSYPCPVSFDVFIYFFYTYSVCSGCSFVGDNFYFGLVHVFWVDRKSTRLNSSHVSISYAVFCLKKKILSALG